MQFKYINLRKIMHRLKNTNVAQLAIARLNVFAKMDNVFFRLTLHV